MPQSRNTDEPSESSKNKAAQTRRSFLKGIGVAGVAATLSPLSPSASAHGAPIEEATPETVLADPPTSVSGPTVAMMLKVNGKDHRVQIDPRASLLDTLRETIHLTGTKKGCDHGQCGACTVHLDGKRTLSCLSLALSCQDREVTTIEGLGTPDKMHLMQAAFVECDGYQCGYCTSGQIMSAVALMKEPIGPDDADIKEAMSGNICRCGAYANIVDAIQQVRKERK